MTNRFLRKQSYFAVASTLLLFLVGTAVQGAVVTFNMMDVAVFFDTPPAVITATTGQVIPGGFDNSSAGNEWTLSSLAFDIDGDLDPLEPDPTVFFDLQVRTATAGGGQIVFDGFDHTFDMPAGERDGGYIVRPVDPNTEFYLTTYVPGDMIGDGDDFIRKAPLFNVAAEDSGQTTNLQPNVDNFVGFILDSGNYGYIRLQWDPAGGGGVGTMTLLDGAYEDSGSPIQIPIVAVDGDYNGDGSVDAADYTVWRDNFPTNGGATVAQGDGDGDGNVTQADYTYWATRFGNGSSTTAFSVPEPASATLVLLALAGLAASRCKS